MESGNHHSLETQTDICLFSAPFSFMPDIQREFSEVLPTVFKEIWRRDELEPDQSVIAWVMNPGQQFTIDETILGLFPRLTVLVTPSTGVNHIDREACAARGIPVYSLLDDREALSSITASAEYTFLLLLNTLRRLDIAVQEVSARRWRTREDLLRGNELANKKIGLVGLGRIGQRIAKYCTAFEADVVFYDPYVQNDVYSASSLEDIFSRCDAICICCTLNRETKSMINKPLLERMRKGGCLINTSRGEVVNETELFSILGERSDLRVAIDVLSGEVNGTHLESPLMELHERGQIVVTPHVAGATVESQTKAARIALTLLKKNLSSRAAL